MKKPLLRLAVLTMILALSGSIGLAGCKSSSVQTTAAAETTAAQTTAAAETTTAAEETTGKIMKSVGVSHYLSAYEFFVKVQRGIDEVAKANGITTSVQDANVDATKQLQQVEAFINSGVNGIICSTLDGVSLNPTVKKAVESKIGFISLYVPCDDATVNYLVDEYKYGIAIGTLAGQWAQKNFPGEKIQAALLRMQDYVPGIERARGEREAFLKEFPTGEIVSDQNSNSVDTAMQATEVILQANPDVRIFITDSDDTGAIGAYEVLKAKVKPEDYYKYGVFGADGVDQAIKYVKENGMYRATVDVYPEQVGKDAVNLLIDWAAGKPVKKTIYCPFVPVDYETAMRDY